MAMLSVKLKFGVLSRRARRESRRERLFFVGVSAFIGLDFYFSSIGW